MFIVDQPGNDEKEYERLVRTWGEIAAEYFEELRPEKPSTLLRVGISGGETILEFVDSVPYRSRNYVQICTTALVGRGVKHRMLSHIDPVVNATLLWVKCGRAAGNCIYATAPPYDDRVPVQDEMIQLARREGIRQALEHMNHIDIAFVGLGFTNPAGDPGFIHKNRITMMGLIPDSRATSLRNEGAVGDIGYSLFDSAGNGRRNWDLFLTAGFYIEERRGVEFYRLMVAEGKRVVVMAGVQKHDAVRAALKGNSLMFGSPTGLPPRRRFCGRRKRRAANLRVL